MKRSLVCMILVLLLTVSLCGCGKTPDEPAEETVSPAEELLPEETAQPEPPLPPEPTEEELRLDRAQEILQGMTLSEKVGQMFFVRCPSGDAAKEMEECQLGGYVLFKRDYQDENENWLPEDAFLSKTDSYSRSAKIPPLIGTDEEGGTVARASRNPNLFPEKAKSPQELFAEGGLAAIYQDAFEKNSRLLHCGINVNLAPVADVATDENAFIYDRTLGQNAEATAEYIAGVVKMMSHCDLDGEQRAIGAVLKHFPGYGNNADTHTGIAIDERSIETFREEDFLPFRAGMEAGPCAVMVSHNIVKCMDEELPATLSPAVHRILREELGFDGVIITDDMGMSALETYTADGTATVMAIQAGNDMIMTADYREQIAQVILALEDGTLTEERIDESVLRILQWKMELGILE